MRVRKNFVSFEEWCDARGIEITIEPAERGFKASITPSYSFSAESEDEAIRLLGRNYCGKRFGSETAPERWRE